MSLKLLVTSDFHGDEELKEAAVEEANTGDYDVFVNLGDYLEEDYAEDLFDSLEIPGVGTTGNWDMDFDQEFLDDSSIAHFLQAPVDDEYLIILIGGDFPDDVKEKVEDLIEQHGNPEKIFIGSHYPPERVGDRVRTGNRIGFEQFRELIIKHKPAVWANGHVHEQFGERELLGVPVLNAASEETGKAFSVTIGDEGGAQEIEEVKLVEK